MSGGNDCLDARAVTFSLEKILRTGILCASQASNVGTKQSVSSIHSPSVIVKFPATSAPEGPLASAVRASLAPPPDVLDNIDAVLNVFSAMPARKPLSTVTNASIAYIAGFVAKAVEERRTCTACPYLHEAHSSSHELVGLISLSTRGGLTFPKPEFVAVLAAVKKAVDFAMPHIGTKDVRKKLANIITPYLIKCPPIYVPGQR
ncbi:hypothetical protein MTO96_049901 [Rhipicephalus appendiculatus]